MEIQEGKYYRDALGNKIGPMVLTYSNKDNEPNYRWMLKDGRSIRWDDRGVSEFRAHDLVEEWVDPPSVDLTKLEKPLGLLDEATLKALKAHGGPYEKLMGDGSWADANELSDFSWKNRVMRVNPSPPKPLEFWVNEYPDGISGTMYVCEGFANAAAKVDRTRVIHFREVI